MRVFISSTSEDLGNFRAAARDAVMSLDCHPVMMMEYVHTSRTTTLPACREMIDGADIFLLIVAFRRGWVPTRVEGGDGESSITALEVEHALKARKPILVFMSAPSWPGNLWENDPLARNWVDAFRKGMN